MRFHVFPLNVLLFSFSTGMVDGNIESAGGVQAEFASRDYCTSPLCPADSSSFATPHVCFSHSGPQLFVGCFERIGLFSRAFELSSILGNKNLTEKA